MSQTVSVMTRYAFVDMPADQGLDAGLIGPHECVSLDEALDKVMAYVGARLGYTKERLTEMGADDKLNVATTYFIEKSHESEWVAAISILSPDLVLQCGNLEVLVRNAAFGRQ